MRAKIIDYSILGRVVIFIWVIVSFGFEREESDCGAMLKRVVSLQDDLMSLGVNSINDWLKAAERP